MSDDILLGVLLGLLGLCYLIALRLKRLQSTIDCIHDFTHFVGESLEGTTHDVVHTALSRMKEEMSEEDQVPAPFKEWDES
jgi:hypothetical protein